MVRLNKLFGLSIPRFLTVGGLVVLLSVATLAMYLHLEEEQGKALSRQLSLTADMMGSVVEQELRRQERIVEALPPPSGDGDTVAAGELARFGSAAAETLRPQGRFSEIAVFSANAPSGITRFLPDGSAEEAAILPDVTAEDLAAEAEEWSKAEGPPRHWWFAPDSEGGPPGKFYLMTRFGGDGVLLTGFPIGEYLASIEPKICPEGFRAIVTGNRKTLLDLGSANDSMYPKFGDHPLDGTGFTLTAQATTDYINTVAEPHNEIVLIGGLLLAALFGVIVGAIFRGHERVAQFQQRYRQFYDRAPVFFHTLDEDLRIVQANETECRALGYTPEEMAGMPFSEIARDPQDLSGELRANMTSDETLFAATTYRTKTGAILDVDLTATVEPDETGAPRWLMTARDVTEQRRSERGQMDSQRHVQFLEEVVERLDDGVMVVDESGEVVYVNSSAAEFLTTRANAPTDKPFAELFGDALPSDSWEKIREAARNGGSWQTQFALPSEAVTDRRVAIRLGGVSERPSGGAAYIFLVRDLTHEHHLSTELAESQRRYRTIFDQAPAGVMILDERGRIIDSNSHHRRNIAGTFDWYVGPKDASIFNHPALIAAGIHKRFDAIYSGGEVNLEAVRFPGAAGREERVLSIKGVPDLDKDGAVRGAFLFVQDITEHHHMRETMQAQTQNLAGEKERALETSRLKSRFLATITHELRTPLNAIIGFSRIIARKAAGVLDEKQMSNLEKIQESSERLLKLINELLDLSKIEAGHMDIHVEQVPLKSLLDIVHEHVVELVERNGNTLSFDVPDSIGAIEADPLRLQQILVNLIGNAAKFTNNGHVIVSVEAVTANDREWVDIAVQDSGIGIPADQQAQVFDEFFQVDGSSTRRFGGTGLGLSISRHFARKMGGDIRLESEPGVGSTFTVRLPRRQITAKTDESSGVRVRRAARQQQGSPNV